MVFNVQLTEIEYRQWLDKPETETEYTPEKLMLNILYQAIFVWLIVILAECFTLTESFTLKQGYRRAKEKITCQD